jgi:3'(2'), 5'-bisphosphate nucleotidase
MDKDTINQLKNIIITAGEMSLVLRKNGLKLDIKNDGSVVTNADLWLSDFIFKSLEKINKKIPIICEERPYVNLDKCEKFWLVDPIDGTRGFIQNKSEFTVNIALIENLQAKWGFIYVPSNNKLYYTNEKGEVSIEEKGALRENQTQDKKEKLYTALVGSGGKSHLVQDYLQNYQLKDTIYVKSSLKLGMIAEGAGDIYPRFSNTMEWDIAAGHALIKANGGNIFTSKGEVLQYGKDNFLNGNFVAVSANILENQLINNF